MSISSERTAVKPLLQVLATPLAVCKLPATSPLPSWLNLELVISEELLVIVRTTDELSLVCAENSVPKAIQAARGWRAIKVSGPLDFSLVGILAGIAAPLAEAGISIFAVSTFDTDYVLVRAGDVSRAVATLKEAGYTFVSEDLQRRS